MVNNNTESIELELSDIERIWQLFYEQWRKRLAQKAISLKTGLPVPVVRSVLYGRYCIKEGKAIVDVPVTPVKEPRQ